MDRPSHKFLASTGLALDDNREGRVGHLPNLLDNLLHLSTRAYQQPQRALDSTLSFPQFARALLDGLPSWLTWLFSASCCSLLLRLNSAIWIARRNDATKY